MHGNVWERCQDRYGSYTSESQIDPAAAGSERIARGGSLLDDAQDVRSAVRGYSWPFIRTGVLDAPLLRTGAKITAVTPETWGQLKDEIPRLSGAQE